MDGSKTEFNSDTWNDPIMLKDQSQLSIQIESFFYKYVEKVI